MVEKMAKDDFHKSVPKFNEENLEHNKKLFEQVQAVAEKKGCTTAQLALAWVHHRGNDVVPIPGTTKIQNLESNIKALSVKLTPEEMAELETIISADAFKGDRYSGAFGALTWRTANTPPLDSWKPPNDKN